METKENKESIVVKEEREYATSFTIEEAKRKNFTFLDLVRVFGFEEQIKDFPMEFTWTNILKVCNMMMVKGERLTDQSEMAEVWAGFTKSFSAFLGIGSQSV